MSVTVQETGAVAPRPGARALRPRRWRPSTALIAVLVPLAFVAVIFGYPVVQMFVRSVTDFAIPTDHGLANYHWFFGSPSQVTILKRTIVTALGVTVICLVLGLPYAYLMTRVSYKWRVLMLGAVLMPFWTSFIVRTYSWVILLQDNGPVVSTMHHLGLGSPRLLGTTAGVTIGMTQVMLPYMILPLYSNLLQIDRRLLLAAQSLGASPRRAFLKVYLPLAVPGMLAGTTIVFILSLGFYFVPALLGSPRNSLLSQQIVQQVSSLLDFGHAGAMAVVLLAATMLLLALGALVARRQTRALGIGTGTP